MRIVQNWSVDQFNTFSSLLSKSNALLRTSITALVRISFMASKYKSNRMVNNFHRSGYRVKLSFLLVSCFYHQDSCRS